LRKRKSAPKSDAPPKSPLVGLQHESKLQQIKRRLVKRKGRWLKTNQPARKVTESVLACKASGIADICFGISPELPDSNPCKGYGHMAFPCPRSAPDKQNMPPWGDGDPVPASHALFPFYHHRSVAPQVLSCVTRPRFLDIAVLTLLTGAMECHVVAIPADTTGWTCIWACGGCMYAAVGGTIGGVGPTVSGGAGAEG
jgi:hypothetical protein